MTVKYKYGNFGNLVTLNTVAGSLYVYYAVQMYVWWNWTVKLRKLLSALKSLTLWPKVGQEFSGKNRGKSSRLG